MHVHPDIHRELARQRHQDLLADARRRRFATGSARSDVAAQATEASRVTPSSQANRRCEGALTAADHFGHREAGGIIVDLFWTRRRSKDEFRVEVEDGRTGARFVLHPSTGREAMQAFHHPFAAARGSMRS